MLDVILPQVIAVQQDASFGRVVEAGQQLEQRGFARAVQPDQHQRLSGADSQIDVIQNPAFGAGVGKADVLKDDGVRNAARDTARSFRRAFRRQDGYDRPVLAQEGGQIVDEQCALVNGGGDTDE